jgi:II/X family phage/plasmid replication protein
MIDFLELSIPFKGEFSEYLSDGSSVFNGDIFDLGIKLGGKGLYKTESGLKESALEYHVYESVPTSHTGMSMKFFHESKHDFPHVKIKASPAKVMQGHNLFGSMDLGLCAREMIGFFIQGYPLFEQYLDIEKTKVCHIDVTFSSRLPSEKLVHDLIAFCKNTSSGQRRSRFSAHTDTAYWGSGESRLIRLKAYNKQKEYREQLSKYQKEALSGDIHALSIVNIMSDPRLIKWSEGLFRWEASILHRYIERQGVSTNLFDLVKFQRSELLKGVCILTDWWKAATRDIFQAFEGKSMRTNDLDAIFNRIRFVHQGVTRYGNVSYTKANGLCDFYLALQREPIEALKARYGKHFFTKFRDLLATGIATKTELQNLKAQHDDPSNVVSIFKLVEVNFSEQRPDWYEEPKSYFARAA